jgi:hypothetical protein
MRDYEYERIYELLKSINRLDLASELMLKRSFIEIDNILSMQEWKEPKFQGLLTPTIFQSNYENIQKILSMKEWEDPKF